jgi:hypothetical protein
MVPMIAEAASGVSRPSASSNPPPASVAPATNAKSVPGR